MADHDSGDGVPARHIAASRPVKRSFSIAGHRTSISLEAAFWEALQALAQEHGRSVASIVAEIDRNRAGAGLSGAVRVWILHRYQDRLSHPDRELTVNPLSRTD